MKVHLEVECTPEEARRALGLPDLSMIQERYLTGMIDAAGGQMKPEALETMIRNWAPMGEAGLALWRQLMEASKGAKPPAA